MRLTLILFAFLSLLFVQQPNISVGQTTTSTVQSSNAMVEAIEALATIELGKDDTVAQQHVIPAGTYGNERAIKIIQDAETGIIQFRGPPEDLAILEKIILDINKKSSPNAQEKVESTEQDRDARLKWWREGKFGMFVHWGVYSTTGGLYNGKKLPSSAEWMMCRGKIPIAEYEKYAEQFNPVKFNAEEFVGQAKRTGMKYIVITAKHHDGFAMFGSTSNSFNVVDKTPFGRDIMKELADECQKQDIKFGFYYSQAQDWHHPGGFGNNWDKTIKRVSSEEYVMQKAVPEVTQLLTDYGPIGIFWWDTPRKMTKESFDALHSLTKLQPNVITNDRLGENYPGDYKTFERHIPDRGPVGKEWEVCQPISGSWGYKIGDEKWKSSKTLIRNLIDISDKGGNYLLNVSPTGEGTLLPQAYERLDAIGKWMDVNSESIYGTTGSPLGSLEWGRCTKKISGDQTTLYLHVFDWPSNGKLWVPGLKNKIQQAKLLDGGAPLSTKSGEDGIEISLPEKPSNEYASVVVLDVEGVLKVVATLPTIGKSGKLALTADKAFIHNNEGSANAAIKEHDNIPHVGYWVDGEAFVEWTFQAKEPGQYEVSAEFSVEKPTTQFSFGLVGEPNVVEMPSTGGYGKYKTKVLGNIEIKSTGEQTIRIKPVSSKWQPINLRQITLQRK